MKKIILFLGLLVLLAVFVIGDTAQMSVTVLPSGGQTITVCSSGCDNVSIQDAVDASLSGTTIYVHDGVYDESINIFEKESLSIIGTSKSEVRILSNFTRPGFWLNNSNKISISNLTILNQYHGVYLWNSYNCSLDKIISYNNTINGILLSGDHNNITNSNFSYNSGFDGISIADGASYNLIKDNVMHDNDNGIFVAFFEEFDTNSYLSNDIFSNIYCDINYIDSEPPACEYDYTAPKAVNDLIAYPGPGQNEIILNWTAVGENYEYGSASSYVLKYSLSSINSGNWDLATTYTQSFDPLWNGSLESESVTMSTNDTYWFALKAVDDGGLETSPLSSDISNSDDSISPWHDIDVVDMACVNGKNGWNCNVSTSGTFPSTNYLYDILNISGNLTNNGNLDENKLIEAKRYRLGWSTVDSKYELLLKQQTAFVDKLFYNISDLSNGNYFSVGIFTDTEYVQQIDARVWSINSGSTLEWYSSTNYPPETGITSDQIFRVRPKVYNDQIVHFYDIPISININTTFNINQILGSGFSCSTSTNCNVNVEVDQTKTTPIWDINPLPAGTYEINITTGNMGDLNTISRIIIIGDP